MSAGMLPVAEIFSGARRPTTASSHASVVRSIAAILHDIQVLIRRYVVVTNDQAIAIALWTAHTHAIAAAECTPYLQITSATKRAGKTRLFEVLEPLVARPWFTGRTSAAALVRKIDAARPSLLLDESDAAFKGEKEYAEALRGILNSGYRRSGRATICVGQGANITVRDFATFGPKAIAGIGTLPDTIADRAVVIQLRRRTQDEPCERWRARDGHEQAAPIHEELVAWAGREPIIAALRTARPALPSRLGDRQSDVWEPLLAIADEAGGDWPVRARSAALALAGSVEDTDIIVDLLGDIAGIVEADARDIVPSRDLLDALIAQPDRPWADFRHGRSLTARGLARLLAPLGIHPAHLATLRGYRRDAFSDAISRYLPSQASLRHSANESGADLANPMRHSDPPRDGSKSAKTPIDPGRCDAMTHETGDERVNGCLPLNATANDDQEAMDL